MRLLALGALLCLTSQTAMAEDWRVVERRPRLTLSIDRDSVARGSGGTVVFRERQDWHVPMGGHPPLVQLDSKSEVVCGKRLLRVLWLTGRLKDGSTTQDPGQNQWYKIPRGSVAERTYRAACRESRARRIETGGQAWRQQQPR